VPRPRERKTSSQEGFSLEYLSYHLTIVPIDALEAIADPTRRRIVEMLAARDLTVGGIVEEFEMSTPAISQHLKVLREAGLVNSRVSGQSRIQSLNVDGLRQIQGWLVTTMSFWNQRLDALEAALLDDSSTPSKPTPKS
jgi:DNA-binding transcriptional ArsR family regulator